MKTVKVEKVEIHEPLFTNIVHRLIGFDAWCEKNKQKFLLDNNKNI